MSDQVFISYSTDDRVAAEAVHDALQAAHIDCWIAHHDIQPGDSWGREIRDAIRASNVFLLILSEHSNTSQYVLREVTAAVDQLIPILTMRITDVMPSDDLEFFLSTTQWLNAFSLPVAGQHKLVIQAVRRLLQEAPKRPEPVAPRAPDPAVITQAAPEQGRWAQLAQKYRKQLLASAALVVFGLLGSLGMTAGLPWWRGRHAPQIDVSLSITDLAPQHVVGDTFRLHATLTGAAGPIQWRSGDTTVAKVGAGDSLFRAVGAGSADLYAEAEGRSDTVRVTISQPAVASLTIDRVPAIHVGDTVELKAVARDAAGKILKSQKPEWSSRTPLVVSVDAENDVAIGIKAGSGRVVARVGTVSRTLDIRVQATVPPPTANPGAGQGSRPPLQINPALVKGLANTPVTTPANTSANTPTGTRMGDLAKECIDALYSADVKWLELHYKPADANDYKNLKDLKTILGNTSHRVTGKQVYTASLADASIQFRVDFAYRRFTGGNAAEHAEFRVDAESSGTTWNVASCRIKGSIVKG